LKVAEFQRRGLVHFHVVIRIDGGGEHFSDPPAWLSTAMVEVLVRETVAQVSWAGYDGQLVRWGEQCDVSALASEECDQRVVASYLAKYATKTTSDTLALARCFRSRSQILRSNLSSHHEALALSAWDLASDARFERLRLSAHAHTFGYGGQILTKSRSFSTTFRELRLVRADYQRARGTGDNVVLHLHYDGRGYDDPRAQRGADVFHAMKVELRREGAAARRQALRASTPSWRASPRTNSENTEVTR
jgi:hypothetical protein